MENKNNQSGMDPAVLPLVNYFNSIGLKTHMSCEGHNKTNKSMFWIEFDKNVTEADVEAFLIQLKKKYGTFATCGCFAMRMFPGPKYTMRRWRYMAATHEAAYAYHLFFTTGKN
jgi:hypothetical protein